MDKKQISLDGLARKTTLVCFDDAGVYIVKEGAEQFVPFADVLTLSKTHTALNNRYFWRLEYRVGEAAAAVEFRPNTTLWNRNFKDFHSRLSEVRPEAIRSPYRWWSL